MKHFYSDGKGIKIIEGDNREVMKQFPDNTFHAIVTDPPYELGFMGKKWDSSGIAYDQTMWRECLRVLKPGGHLLSFGGSRTYHRMACAIEDAGFEIRDMIEWIYGQGFPKSLDVSKAMDKHLGEERPRNIEPEKRSKLHGDRPWMNDPNHKFQSKEAISEQSKKWQGWGTALKPAHEPICLARKPLIGTVVENVLEHGTGAINIDACRIEGEVVSNPLVRNAKGFGSDGLSGGYIESGTRNSSGRFPANLILDSEAAAMLDEQSGQLTSGKPIGKKKAANQIFGKYQNEDIPLTGFGDTGGASRFFYTAKASGVDRGHQTKGALPLFGIEEEQFRNTHPTVKPIALMIYLLKLVCPPNAHILDPFGGSGTTCKAAKNLGIECTMIERDIIYCEIAKNRIEH